MSEHDTDTQTETTGEPTVDAPAEQPVSETARLEALETEGEIAADYLEELLDIADLDGDLDMDVEGDRASVSIVGADLSQLVGRDGEVVHAQAQRVLAEEQHPAPLVVGARGEVDDHRLRDGEDHLHEGALLV
ncbi:MAG TPA: hypothetical protein VFU85_04630, partial [Nocardioides sp.]|nr:hypothetical protein [Nocardioides sp.]